MFRPVLHQYLLDLVIILLQLVFDLFSPHYRPCFHGQIPYVADLYVLGVHVALEELTVQQVYALLHCFKQLTLIFLYG